MDNCIFCKINSGEIPAKKVYEELLGYMMNKIKEIAKLAGIENGYRTVINCGENAFQTVLHLHVHVLGNRKLNWPPG